jgi:hypothetical protein
LVAQKPHVALILTVSPAVEGVSRVENTYTLKTKEGDFDEHKIC